MKRALLVLSLITLTASFANAQYNTRTKTMLYAEGGINLSTFYQSANTEKSQHLRNITRPMIGLYLKTKFPTLIGFDAGVSVSQQGSNTSDSGAAYALFVDSAIAKAVLTYGYAYGDALYYFELQGDNSVHAGAGLYIGYALNGNRYVGSTKTKLDFDDRWTRLDFGFQLKTALNIKEFLSVGVQYRIAFLPVLKTFDRVGDNNNLRNSVLTLSAAIRLFQVVK